MIRPVRSLAFLLVALLLVACAPAAAPTPEPTAAPAAAPSVAPSAAAAAGELMCIDVEGAEPVCGRQALDPCTVVSGGKTTSWGDCLSDPFAVTTPVAETRNAAGGVRKLCITGPASPEKALALNQVGDRPDIPFGTEPVCVTAPTAEGTVEGLRIVGDVLGSAGTCGSCWAFSVTPDAVRFGSIDPEGAVETTEIVPGTPTDVVVNGMDLTVRYELAADQTAQIIIE